MIIDDVEVIADKKIFDFEELKNYVGIAKAKFPQKRLTTLKVSLTDDGKVACDYTIHGKKFERIRRITGYLVGTIDRWNDAKQEEEKERVKHDTEKSVGYSFTW